MRTVHPRAWEERSVEDSIASFRASFKRMSVPENEVKVTCDTEALWARVRFLIPGTDPRRVVEEVHRYDATKHPRKNHRDVLWTLARWLNAQSLRVKKGESFGVVFHGEEPARKEGE